ncbi:LOW QUALITY PROTEIN: hypothetical protein CRUP_026792 [Coryphaenoides rupestris]|nr:LOW QUALITY PROTEIN: hypothetical protein CRUP_026792 [Coryphaenoides rupestris]
MRASAEPGPPRPSSSSSALPCASSLASRAYISSARFLMSRPMALVSRLMLLSRRMEVRKRAFCLPRFFTFKRSRPISVRMARTSLKKLSMAASSPWNSTMCCSRSSSSSSSCSSCSSWSTAEEALCSWPHGLLEAAASVLPMFRWNALQHLPLLHRENRHVQKHFLDAPDPALQLPQLPVAALYVHQEPSAPSSLRPTPTPSQPPSSPSSSSISSSQQLGVERDSPPTISSCLRMCSPAAQLHVIVAAHRLPQGVAQPAALRRCAPPPSLRRARPSSRSARALIPCRRQSAASIRPFDAHPDVAGGGGGGAGAVLRALRRLSWSWRLEEEAAWAWASRRSQTSRWNLLDVQADLLGLPEETPSRSWSRAAGGVRVRRRRPLLVLIGALGLLDCDGFWSDTGFVNTTQRPQLLKADLIKGIWPSLVSTPKTPTIEA